MTKRRDLIRELEQAGYVHVGGTKHDKYRKGSVTIEVKRQARIADEIAQKIRRQAGLR